MNTKTLRRNQDTVEYWTTIAKFTLSGALLGAAAVGVFTQIHNADLLGAFVGGAVVFFAKIRQVF